MLKVKSESEVAQSCPILRDPMDCSLPGISVHGIFQARVLDGVPLPSPTTKPGIDGNILIMIKSIYGNSQLTS